MGVFAFFQNIILTNILYPLFSRDLRQTENIIPYLITQFNESSESGACAKQLMKRIVSEIVEYTLYQMCCGMIISNVSVIC